MAGLIGGAVEGGIVFNVTTKGVDFNQPYLYGAAGVKIGLGEGLELKCGGYYSSAYPDTLKFQKFVGLSISLNIGFGVGAMILEEGSHYGFQAFLCTGEELSISAEFGKCVTKRI